MTQSLTALFSPETSPHPADLQPFQLLCDTLFFYVLPDRSIPQPDQAGQTGYVPVRLPEEKQTRFLSLAQELIGHEAEFLGGLMALLFAARGDSDEASAGSLAARLRSGPQAASSQKTADEALWQAMLILKLSEMFREEQREITQRFKAISDREAALFAAIRGEEEKDGEEEEQTLQELAAGMALSGTKLNLTRLAMAWGRLYIRDPRAAEIPLLVTPHEELQDLLAGACESFTGRPPRPLVSLTLPTQAESMEDVSLIEIFRVATNAARVKFNRLLLGVAASGAISAEQLNGLQEAGNDLHRAILPFLKGHSDEKALHFYACEGVSLVDLFVSLGGGAQSAEAQRVKATVTGLLAVLR